MSQTFILFTEEHHNKERGPRTLILDLDETLVHSYENPTFLDTYGIYSNPETKNLFHPTNGHQIVYSMVLSRGHRMWGLVRPGTYEFLEFAHDYFDNILVWSAGVKEYVDKIVNLLFTEAGFSRPRKIWARDKCSIRSGNYHKPISSLIYNLNSSGSPLHIDPATTLIVDDREYTFQENPANGILIPPFCPGGSQPSLINLLNREDRFLFKLMDWLKRPEVRNCTDVRYLDRSQIFR